VLDDEAEDELDDALDEVLVEAAGSVQKPEPSSAREQHCAPLPGPT
jgi:hypothetical protein